MVLRIYKNENPNPEGIRKLFVGGLAVTTQSQDLLRYFSRFGLIEECAVMTDHSTGKSRGFGFVTFRILESVEAVFRSEPHVIKNKKVVCKIAHPQGKTVLQNYILFEIRIK